MRVWIKLSVEGFWKSASAGAGAILKNWGAVRKCVRINYWSAGVRAAGFWECDVRSHFCTFLNKRTRFLPCSFTGSQPIIYLHILVASNILCQHKIFWRGTKCSQIFGLVQNIWTSTKHFVTCKRTRHSCFGTSWPVLERPFPLLARPFPVLESPFLF